MKKLTLLALISSALSASAFAGNGMDKLNSFSSLDSNSNGYISHDEAGNNKISDHFADIDSNSDSKLSSDEFNSYLKNSSKAFTDETKTAKNKGKNEMLQRYDTAQNDFGMDDTRNEASLTGSAAAEQQRTSTSAAGTAMAQNRQSGEQVITSTGNSGNAMTQREAGDETGMTSNDSATVMRESRNSDRNTDYSSNRNGNRAQNDQVQEKSEIVASNEFKMMDKNRDGKVSKQEASDNGVNDTFEDMDQNGDQKISRVEYTEYRENEDYE